MQLKIYNLIKTKNLQSNKHLNTGSFFDFEYTEFYYICLQRY